MFREFALCRIASCFRWHEARPFMFQLAQFFSANLFRRLLVGSAQRYVGDLGIVGQLPKSSAINSRALWFEYPVNHMRLL